jgi:hypothetical protein
MTVQSADGTAWGATVVRKDEASGLALLRLGGNAAKLTPLPVSDAFAAGAVSCVSFPSVNIFDPAPERLEGAAPPAKEGWTVRLARHPRLAGGPLLAAGKVVGVELASRDSEAARVPAATLEQLKQLLGQDARPPARAPADPAASTVQVTAVREGAR